MFAEKFFSRVYLEELKSNVKKLLRVQEDEKKYSTYLVALKQTLSKIEQNPLGPSLEKDELKEWMAQARKGLVRARPAACAERVGHASVVVRPVACVGVPGASLASGHTQREGEIRNGQNLAQQKGATLCHGI